MDPLHLFQDKSHRWWIVFVGGMVLLVMLLMIPSRLHAHANGHSPDIAKDEPTLGTLCEQGSALTYLTNTRSQGEG